MSEIKTGVEVYNTDGIAAQYIGASPDYGHVVMPIFEHDEDSEPHLGSPEVWREVFESPPRAKLADDLTELQSSIATHRKTLGELNAEISAVKSQRGLIEREAKQNPELAPLALWLSGEAKFAALLGGDYGNQFSLHGFRVGPVSEVFKAKEEYGRQKLRLVALYWEPDAERTYNVRVARYEDGSGDKAQRAFFGRTEQEAMDAAAAHVAGEQRRQQNEHVYAEIALWLEHFGYANAIADRCRSLMVEYKNRTAENLAKNAREELARAEAAVAAARAKVEGVMQA